MKVYRSSSILLCITRQNVFKHLRHMCTQLVDHQKSITLSSLTISPPTRQPPWGGGSCTNSCPSQNTVISVVLNVVGNVYQQSFATLNVEKLCLMRAASSTGGKSIWVMSPRRHAPEPTAEPWHLAPCVLSSFAPLILQRDLPSCQRDTGISELHISRWVDRTRQEDKSWPNPLALVIVKVIAPSGRVGGQTEQSFCFARITLRCVSSVDDYSVPTVIHDVS